MSCDRREFLGTVARGALAAGALPVLQGCGNTVPLAPYIDATVDEDPGSPRYGQVEVVVGRYPDLQRAGGAVTVRVAQPAAQHAFTVPDKGLLLLHLRDELSLGGDEHPDPATRFVAADSECPHAGCPLGYNPDSGLIECPCHSSRFRAVADPNDPKICAGTVVHRPAESDLILYQLSYETFTESIWIDLRRPRACNQLPAPEGGVVAVELELLPVLAEIGGVLVARPVGFTDLLMVIRLSSTTFNVTSAICRHRRCTVGYDAAAMQLACPCHGSRYDLDGTVKKGPAEENMPTYSAVLDGTILKITVG